MPIPPGWDVDRAARLYRQGWTLRQLAGEFGRTPSVVRRVLVKVGVTMRPARLPQSGPPTEELVKLRESGLTYAQVAAKAGMTESGVHARFRRAGLLHGRWAASAVVYQAAPANVMCARCDESIPAGEQAAKVPGLHARGWAHARCSLLRP